ncbi:MULTISPECIES: GNAT family N-acetyltransferase [Bacillus]|uniref:GNAT family N-acetyltransferase n=1 Tax=Bacillus TaxID=1386 RepID=UPI00209FC802|nr:MULTISPECIES: GNAT family N-acetyltransferase [Bacillus]MCP1157222.1 GNAT family N-acetyltransferase [Bacillus infantis]MDT0162872.1 GNAT family N-acetyltransferase [Bacillus sp. AG4(2022)]
MPAAVLKELNGECLGEGCYCLRSKPGSSGYQNKNLWLTERFTEGLKYLKVLENGRQAGFIEYTPIEFSSRAIYGENYLVIHCLWVHVTGKGYASQLIERCLEDARKQQKAGVIVITNPDTSWTPSADIFIKHGFVEKGRAPYGFELMVYKFGDDPDPYFPGDWKKRLEPFEELTILRMPQCPFVGIAADNLTAAAEKLGLRANIIELTSREELLRLSPTPYGIYGAVFKKILISYHRLTVHSAVKRLKALGGLG